MAKVALIAYTPQPEQTMAAAAKFCYSTAGVECIMDGFTEEKTACLVEMLSGIGHESLVEHTSFTLTIEGVSRTSLAQMTCHRIASYGVRSQKYVAEHQLDYVIPPEVETILEARQEFTESVKGAQRWYETLTHLLQEKHQARMTAEGKKSEGAACAAQEKVIEGARFMLPNTCETRVICTINVRSPYNLFLYRCCSHAQWEIQEAAIQMLRLVCGIVPNLFSHCGPPCVRGGCPEGRINCGRMTEVRMYYKNLEEQP